MLPKPIAHSHHTSTHQSDISHHSHHPQSSSTERSHIRNISRPPVNSPEGQTNRLDTWNFQERLTIHTMTTHDHEPRNPLCYPTARFFESWMKRHPRRFTHPRPSSAAPAIATALSMSVTPALRYQNYDHIKRTPANLHPHNHCQKKSRTHSIQRTHRIHLKENTSF